MRRGLFFGLVFVIALALGVAGCGSGRHRNHDYGCNSPTHDCGTGHHCGTGHDRGAYHRGPGNDYRPNLRRGTVEVHLQHLLPGDQQHRRGRRDVAG